MRIGILGTGMVGMQLAADIAANGHDVVIGTRDPEQTRNRPGGRMVPPMQEWLDGHTDIGLVQFSEAATHAELAVNATSGAAALPALELAGASNLGGKVLLDLSNPLDFSDGFPPTLSVKDTDSMAEQIQRSLPQARVVKALNMLSAPLMLHPERLPEPTTLFVSGDDAAAKEEVVGFLRSFGWEDIVDLGDLSSARGMEMWMPLWLRILGAVGGPMFSLRLVR